MDTALDLKADWQAAQAAADKAYATHLSADRQAAISWGGNGQLKDAAYTASEAWKEGDRVADLASLDRITEQEGELAQFCFRLGCYVGSHYVDLKLLVAQGTDLRARGISLPSKLDKKFDELGAL